MVRSGLGSGSLRGDDGRQPPPGTPARCSIIELSKMLRESRLVMDGLGEVQCPSCGEHFSVPRPPAAECPAQLDYDCEVCCRPMVIVIDEEGGAFALGADDSFSV